MSPHPITTCLYKKSILSFPVDPLNVGKATVKFSQNLLFSRLKNTSSLKLSSQGRRSSPLVIFVALLWTWSNNSISFLCGRSQNWTQCSRWGLRRVEGQNQLPWPAGHTSLDAIQDMVGMSVYVFTQLNLEVQKIRAKRFPEESINFFCCNAVNGSEQAHGS